MMTLTGEWRLEDGGTVHVGTERWRLEETSQTILWNSVIEKSVPFPHREELTVTVVPRKWQITTIRIKSVGEGREESFEGKVEKSHFQFIIRRAERVECQSIPVSASTEFDYLSPAFNTITFHRLRLRWGESREIEVVYIFPVSRQDSFLTRMVRQRYRRLRDEHVSVQAGQFPTAKHYLYKNLESGFATSIWTDNLETVLRYEKLCELLSYNRTV